MSVSTITRTTGQKVTYIAVHWESHGKGFGMQVPVVAYAKVAKDRVGDMGAIRRALGGKLMQGGYTYRAAVSVLSCLLYTSDAADE